MKNTEKTLRKSRKKIVIMSLIMIGAIFAIALIPNNLITVYAKNADVIDVLSQSRNDIPKDDFDENKVIVVLNQKDSRFDKTVKIEDFGIDLEQAGLIRSGNYSAEGPGKNLESESEAVRTGRAVISNLFKVDKMERGTITEKSGLFQILSIELPVGGKERVLKAIEELEKSEIVYSAEPEYNHNAMDLWLPNDTHYATNQWGLTGVNGIQAENAWDFTRGNININVGLFETGAQQNHPDLNGRFIAPNFILGATDHGTHVAGIVGAISNNNRGMAGVAQSRMLLLDRTSNNFANSLSHAANQGVWVINASYSYTINDSMGNVIGYAPLNTSHAAAIWNYGELGGLLICAAGNGIGGVAQNTDTTPMYPASYSTHTIPRKTFLGFEIQPARPITNVISVGSIDNGGARSSFSNFGSTSVQIFAPGRNILSTFPTTRWGTTVAGYTQIAEGYARTQGTSMAAPHVTGVAALIRSINQNLTAVQVKNAILNNVSYSIDASGNNRLAGLCSSQGILNAHQSLSSIAFTHTASGNNATITGINFDPTGELVIPTLINGRTVTKIGNDVFGSQEQLTNITIPNSVINLNNNTFHNNTSVYWLGNYAFIDNIFLESLNEQTEFIIPDIIAGKIIIQIGDYAFEDDTTLTKVTIPSSVAYIGDHAFSNCTNLSQVEISDETTSILGSTPFSGCTQLYNTVVSIRTDYHRIIDDTGRLIWTAHDFVYDDNHSSTHHDLICVTCGFEDTKIHNKQVVNGIEVCSTCPWVGGAHVHHEHTHSYIPIPHSGKFPVNLHKAYCFCGEYIEEMCLGRIAEDGKAYCIHCGRDMTGALGQIINRILLPESDFHDNDIYCVGDGHSNDCCITKDDLLLSELKNVLYMDVKRRERSFYGGA